VAQRLDEGLIGDAHVLVATAGEDEGAFFVDQVRELGGEPRLPHPWLARQERHPPLPRRRLLPQLEETLGLLLPSHEDPAHAGQERRKGEGRHGQRVPRHLEGWQRCQQALQFECAERSELMTAS